MIAEEFHFPLEQLPIELSREITTTFVKTSSRQDIANFVRVSRVIHNWVVPLFYQSVFLSTERQISLFAATLERTPRLRPVVTNLCIFISKRDISLEDDNHCFSDVTDEDEDRSTQNDADDFYREDESEDEALEHEAVPDNLLDEDTHAYTAFRDRPHPGSPYEFTPMSDPLNLGRRKTSSALRFFGRALKPQSLIQAHQVIILKCCCHLRSLTILTDSVNDGFCSTINVFAFGGLAELAVHDLPPDMTDPVLPPIHEYFELTHLRLLDTPRARFDVIALRAPNITHLQMWRDTDPSTYQTLANLKHLSHLWLTPSPMGVTGSLSHFLCNLQKHCSALISVRIDVGPDEELDFDTALFPFAHVHRYAHRDPSWDAETMWSTVQRGALLAPGHDLIRENQETKEEYNVYTARLEEYWELRSCGGGWDD